MEKPILIAKSAGTTCWHVLLHSTASIAFEEKLKMGLIMSRMKSELKDFLGILMWFWLEMAGTISKPYKHKLGSRFYLCFIRLEKFKFENYYSERDAPISTNPN